MRVRLLAVLIPLLVAAGCGGGGDDEASSPAPPPAPPPAASTDASTLREPTPDDLAIMVVPQDGLGSIAGGLELGADSGAQDNFEAAEDSLDPDDTVETIEQRGRVIGYQLSYSDSDLEALQEKEGVVQVGTTVTLYEDADAAAANLERQADDFERFEGREPEPGIRVESVERFAVEGLGDEAIGIRTAISFAGVTAVGTTIGFRVGSLIGSASVIAADDTDRNADIEEAARALDARIEGVLSGQIDEEPVPLPAEPTPAPPAESGPPAGAPDLSTMVLALEDLPEGATVAREGYVDPQDVLATYEREFEVTSAAFGETTLIGLESDVDLFASELEARAAVSAVPAVFTGEGSEEFLLQQFGQGAGFEASDIAVEEVPAEGIGDQASVIKATFETPAGTFDAYFMFLRVGPAAAQIYAVGPEGRVSFDDLRPLAERATERMAAALEG